jgi:hypothetical protein
MSRREKGAPPVPSRSVRLREFFARLERRAPFASFEEAYAGLVSILESVEDELTGIENNPENWKSDGRLYPPQPDHWSREPGQPHITRMRSRGHYILIAANGAIEIEEVGTGVVRLSIAGLDGRKVWDRHD